MTGHLFLDESKHRGFTMVTVAVPTPDLRRMRKALSDLLLPGQRRLHMKSERDARKRRIASTIVDLGINAVVYDAGRRYATELVRRQRCLDAAVQYAARVGAVRLVIETDETLVHRDRQILFSSTRAHSCADLRYEHLRASEESLLALPDAVAWCWAKGGDWRRRVESVVVEVCEV